jgi:hypothetical protein
MRLTFGDGFKFGCGYFLALAVPTLLVMVLLTILTLSGSQVLTDLFRSLR